jgi:hypothetical protein
MVPVGNHPLEVARIIPNLTIRNGYQGTRLKIKNKIKNSGARRELKYVSPNGVSGLGQGRLARSFGSVAPVAAAAESAAASRPIRARTRFVDR